MANPLPSGKIIAHYRILSRLGAGGMGEVYLAEDMLLNRKVAIKSLSGESLSDDRSRKRLLREAQTAATLDHPNICTIHEVGEEGGLAFIVMQYIEGETLAARIQRSPLGLREAIVIAMQVSDALAAAHAQGIVHRDIKPQNIMITPRGQAYILDFGLAKLVRDESQSHEDIETKSVLTEPNAIAGTIVYMSPEQVKGEALDARSDIFSFGAVLYEMLTGGRPFERKSSAERISAILTQNPPPVSQTAKNCPDELGRIVTKTLAKSRDERYVSAGDLYLDLKSLNQRLEFEAEFEKQGREEQTRVGTKYLLERVTRRKTWAIAVVGLLLITVSTVVYLLRVGAAIDSIAILPFFNTSADPNMEYLSDGVTDSLINTLSQAPNLHVMSRNSVFRYKGKETDARAAGSSLGVRAVLTGRILQRGDSLLISAELVDVRDNSHIWGEQYNRKAEDILAVQDDISRRISENLRLKLSGAEKKLLTKRYTENVEAYQLYLQGRYHWNKRTPDSVKKGIELLKKAIAVDPKYALAYAGLADSYNVLAILQSLPPKLCYPEARKAANQALEMDEGLGEAHTALARVKVDYDWDWVGAENEYRRALALNPNYPTAHQWYDIYLTHLGRYSEALAHARRAQELDSLSLIINSNVGWVFFNMREFDQAQREYQKVFDLDPNFVFNLQRLGNVYEKKKEYAKAVEFTLKAVSLSEGREVEREAREAYRLSGWTGFWRRRLGQLSKQAAQRYVSPYELAQICARLGEKDQAFDWLRQAYDERDQMHDLKCELNFDELRSDPRFTDLLKRVGFPDR